MRALTPVEARVLAVLVEKQATVPDTYPLSLNALTAGCNQKTAREPVMNLAESEVLDAIAGLKSQSLVFEGSSSRVTRYEHNLPRGVAVPIPAAALLATLVLRGPQTMAELRANVERLQRFADNAAVETVLQELADRFPPRAQLLPRAPGAREARWVHLLCGEAQVPVGLAAASGSDEDRMSVGEAVNFKAEVKAELARQAEEIATLRALVQRLASELGIDTGAPSNPPA
jgi:uncharacterized protein YceH (UPF0502 family)